MINKSVPLVTVVLPIYNAGPYLRDAVVSVLKQSVTDFELIAINDGSTDNSLRILKELGSADSRIRIISRENRGLVYSLNEGIQHSRGKWVARMDADDVCLPNRLALQIKHADENNFDVCGGFIRTFGMCISSLKTYPLTDNAIKLQLLFNTAFAHPAVILKRQSLKQHLYDSGWAKIEDYELWTRLAADGCRMGNVPHELLRYRKTFGQVTSKSRNEQDRLRPEIAEAYRARAAFAIPANVLQRFHDRGGDLSIADVESVIDFFAEQIHAKKDIEGVLKANLKVFLLHQAPNALKTRKKMISSLLSRKDLRLLSTLSYMNFSPKNSFWKVMYYLK